MVGISCLEPRFPRQGLERRRTVFSGYLGIGKALVEDLGHCTIEAVGIVNLVFFGALVVEAEYLLIQIAKHMEWFDTNVSTTQVALEETPEVFQLVSMDRAIDICFRVVDDFVRVFVEPS